MDKRRNRQKDEKTNRQMAKRQKDKNATRYFGNGVISGPQNMQP